MLVVMWLGGAPWELDLVTCRVALVRRQVKGELKTRLALAKAVGYSRSSVSRFFSGRPCSLNVVQAILAALGIEFEDVATPCVPTFADIDLRD